MTDYPLGRVHVPDPRDALFPMSLALPPAVPVQSKTWRRGPLRVDQGQHGYCVGYAGSNWEQCAPVQTKVTNDTGTALYMACKEIDGLPPGTEGTYDRALMKVLQAQGRIERYLWAQDAGELLQWILTTGPVLVGTPWFTGMFAPDARFYVHPTGSVAGGHEYLVRGYSHGRKAYRCSNSWGRWADNGDFWIAKDNLEALVFGGQGDACVAVEKQP